MSTELGATSVDRRLFVGGALATAVASGPGSRAATSGQRLIPAAWERAPAIELWPEGPPGGGYVARPLPIADAPPVFLHDVARPYLRLFRPTAPANGRALLIVPGGAYMFVSIDNEGVDVAQAAAALGYTAFVLVYRLPREGWKDRADVPLQDGQRAMRLIRSRAKEFGFDPARIGLIGFSAGGHLAASVATDHAQAVYMPRDAIDRLPARPDVAGLVYPVISMTPPVTHAGSRDNLLGPSPSAGAVARRSPAGHVGADTPPTLLVHAIDDGAVPVENSLEMLAALRRARRPAELHLFEEGGHGFGMGPSNLPNHRWFELFAAFADRHLSGPAAAGA